MTGRDRRSVRDVRQLGSDLLGGQRETRIGIFNRGTKNHSEHTSVAVDQGSAGGSLFHSASDRVHLTGNHRGAIDVRAVEFHDLANARGGGAT